MIILLDTTVLEKDPLLRKNNKIQILLEQSRDGFIKIYVSELVLIEAKKHFIKSSLDELKSARKDIDYIMQLETKIKELKEELYKFDTDKLDSIFEDRINELTEDYNINIVDYNNVITTEMVEAYKESKAPFHNNIDSWKDFIIWNSYKKIIEENIDDYYIFISGNTNDFANPNDKNLLHKDLMIDGKNILYFNEYGHFMNKCNEYKLINEDYENKKEFLEPKRLFEEDNDVNEEFIIENFEEDILSVINDIDYSNELCLDEQYEDIEIVEPESTFNVEEISEVDIGIIDNGILVTGNIEVSININIFAINIMRESSADYYNDYETAAIINASFSFLVDENQNISNFKLEIINVSEY